MKCLYRNLDWKCEVTCKECDKDFCKELDDRAKSTDEILGLIGVDKTSVVGRIIKILDARSFLYFKGEDGGK